MEEIIEIIIVLLIVSLMFWLIFKILKGITSFLFGSSSNEETSSQTVKDIDSNSNKDTSNPDDGAIDNEPSDLKYNNEVYISLKNKLQKAYEGFKRSGYDVEWDSDNDGFIMFENDSPSVDDPIYAVEVHYDDRNNFNLNDPFYIVKYGFVFKRSDNDGYIEQADYLNNSEKRKPAIFYTADIIKDSNFGVYFVNLIIADHKMLCEDAEKLGEFELFELLFLGAIKAYLEGEEIYNARIRNPEKY